MCTRVRPLILRERLGFLSLRERLISKVFFFGTTGAGTSFSGTSLSTGAPTGSAAGAGTGAGTATATGVGTGAGTATAIGVGTGAGTATGTGAGMGVRELDPALQVGW